MLNIVLLNNRKIYYSIKQSIVSLNIEKWLDHMDRLSQEMHPAGNQKVRQ